MEKFSTFNVNMWCKMSHDHFTVSSYTPSHSHSHSLVWHCIRFGRVTEFAIVCMLGHYTVLTKMTFILVLLAWAKNDDNDDDFISPSCRLGTCATKCSTQYDRCTIYWLARRHLNGVVRAHIAHNAIKTWWKRKIIINTTSRSCHFADEHYRYVHHTW